MLAEAFDGNSRLKGEQGRALGAALQRGTFPLPSPTQGLRRLRGAAALLLLLAMSWQVWLRIPLVLNAPIHLDSDLAVDGLTLLEAVRGHWRWHYPGTPYTGIGAVLLSFAQARLWETNPVTLVSGGTVAHLGLTLACFALARTLFGLVAALWSLVPLTFASTGVIWLSSRITGGHLLAAAWSALAWLILLHAIQKSGLIRTALLGMWCGLGLYLDSMFALTLAALVPAGLIGYLQKQRETTTESRRSGKEDSVPGVHQLALAAALTVGFLVGVAPRAAGILLEPHNAYRDQFSSSWEPDVLVAHLTLLMRECLPRLITGHRLPGFESDPAPELLGSPAPLRTRSGSPRELPVSAVMVTILGLGLFMLSLAGLGRFALSHPRSGEKTCTLGILACSFLVFVAFITNRNVFNSDNYRYLVLWLIPWSLGFGWLLLRLQKTWLGGRLLAPALALVFAVLFTIDAAGWYGQLGWLDKRGFPRRQHLEDPVLRWLERNPQVGGIYGSYWDVYRLSFLSGGRVLGIPYPTYPNRFPEWSQRFPGGRPETMLVRPTVEGRIFLTKAMGEGGSILHRDPSFIIVSWPVASDAAAAR